MPTPSDACSMNDTRLSDFVSLGAIFAGLHFLFKLWPWIAICVVSKIEHGNALRTFYAFLDPEESGLCLYVMT